MKDIEINFDIVISVTFKTYATSIYLTQNWVISLRDNLKTRFRLSDFDKLVVRKLSWNCSANAYLYWHVDQLHLDVIMFESFTTRRVFATFMLTLVDEIWESRDDFKIMNDIDLFKIDMYIFKMHDEHDHAKIFSFKRCLFLKDIEEANVVDCLIAIVETHFSSRCYLHLLQDDEVINDVAIDVTAFDCRDWDFACVIIDVWARDQDDVEVAWSVVQWIYNVVENLLSLSSEAYDVDLKLNS